MKTKEWLASHLEDGDILVAEVLRELLDSYIHKSEFGSVADGEERAVKGATVKAAIDAAESRIIQTVHNMVSEILAEMLPALLVNYVTGTGLATALADMATKTWVNDQISGLATASDVNESLNQHDDDMWTEIGNRLLPYVLIDNLPSLIDLTPFALKSELALKADASSVYTKQQIDAAVAARPTQTEMAGELSTTVADLPNNTTIAAIRTALNSVIARTNKLSHVACGSETMDVCMSDIQQLQAPNP